MDEAEILGGVWERGRKRGREGGMEEEAEILGGVACIILIKAQFNWWPA